MGTCSVHPDTEAIGTCSQCNAEICENCIGEMKGAILVCHRCLTHSAGADPESDGESTGTTSQQEPELKEYTLYTSEQLPDSENRPLALLAVLGLSLAIMLYQNIFITGQTVEPDSYYTTADQQNLAMQCYNNLFSISALLQEGNTTAIETMSCPVHSQRYIIQMIAGDLVVIDPEPTAMGFRDIRVTRSIGMPEFTPLAN